MIKIEALYFNGKSSARFPVTVIFLPDGEVRIRGDNIHIDCRWQQLKISDRIGNTPRSLYLPDGSKLETRANDSLDRICRHFLTHRPQALLHKLENHWGLAVGSLLLTIAFLWSGAEFGVPLAARWATKSVPVHIEQQIGEQALASLDQWLFKPTKLTAKQQTELFTLFSAISQQSATSYSYRLELRHSKAMGANALALPGGIVVMTDALPGLAENDEQILAVLAHEIGHIEYQHGIRALFQNSLTAIFMAILLGDVTSISTLSVALPTLLVESRYSREFELEADRYAVNFLHSQDISTQHFARILELLTGDSTSEYDYLSSHPATKTRIQNMQKADKL